MTAFQDTRLQPYSTIRASAHRRGDHTMRLEAIVTIVDSLFAEAQLAGHPECAKQVALADRLVLTKTDLVAPILVAPHGAVDAALLFPPQFFDPALADEATHRSGLFADSIDPAHAGRYASVALTADRTLQWGAFDDWLRRIRIGHAEQLPRAKAMLDIDGVDGPVVVPGVHHVLNALVELDAWPKGQRRSRLVPIADQVTIAAARASRAAALSGMIANTQRND